MLVTNAQLITVPAGTDDPGYIARGWMLIEGDRIAAIGEGEPPASAVDAASGDVLDVEGAFVAPGFVSSHSHLFTSGLRGLGVDQTLYGWCNSMLGFTAKCSAEDMYWSTLHGALDFLNNGVTTAYNFTDPQQAWSEMSEGSRSEGAPLRGNEYHSRQTDGCLDSGIRFVDAAGMDVMSGTDEEVFARFEAAVNHTRSMPPERALGMSIMGQVQWSPHADAAEIEVEAMRRYGVTNQAHFLESPEEVPAQQAKFALYRDAGALGPDLVFGHFIQTTPEIIAETARTGTGVSWQPAANGRLASGFAQIPEMLEQGIRVGVGLDDQACTDLADPWGTMRLGIFMQRARLKSPDAMSPELMLRLHTLGAADIIGVGDRVGSLEVGKFADFVVVDPRRPDIGPLWHPVRNYVLSCSTRNLRQVYVGGELVVDDGVSTNPLAVEASRRIHEDLPKVAAREGWPA